MIRLITCLFALLISYSANAQNIDLVANVDITEDCSDIWGYVDRNGIEYAIIGTRTTTKIYSLEDPTTPQLRTSISGASSIWRDIKHYDDYLYVVADQGNDGLLTIDMSAAPDTITHSFFKPQIDLDVQLYVLDRCHNIYIDTLGYAYLAGCNFNPGGVLMFDLNTSRDEPDYIGLVNENYAHDVYVQDDLMVTSDIFAGSFALWDVSDKSNPQFLASDATSSTFTHNAWFSDDKNFVYTTDERANAFVDAFDISDLDNIRRVDKFKPLENVGEGVIPHNTHFLNDKLYTSWYTDGMVITDVTYPDNMIQIGQYKTWTGDSGGFEGCWGAYPFLPSGLLLASDISTGLYVLQPNVQQACYFHGIVKDDLDSTLINAVSVNILSDDLNEGMSNAMGEFKSGIATAGTFQVAFSHPEYLSDTLELSFTNGEITEGEFFLRKKETFVVTGLITDFDGNPISNATVSFTGEELSYDLVTEADGKFTLPVLSGEYTAIAGAWGYGYTTFESLGIFEETYYERQLEFGYQDDFVLDFGWTTSGEARTGQWVREEPIGTFFQGFVSNPNTDASDDVGNKCYVTGNGEGGAGTFDIDDGRVILTSPVMDLTRYPDPTLNYETFFFNAGGGSEGNDYFDISIFNGIDTSLIERITFDGNDQGWSGLKSFLVTDYLEVTNSMQLICISSDDDPGHLVEAAFDHFFVSGEVVSDIEDLSTLDVDINIFPNPTTNYLNIEFGEGLEDEFVGYTIMDIKGSLIQKRKVDFNTSLRIDVSVLNEGTYFLQLESKEGITFSKKFVVSNIQE